MVVKKKKKYSMTSLSLFPKISFIYAEGLNGELGCTNGSIPWMGQVPRDMKFFKETTMLHSILMGRRTAETMKLPLKGRANFVVSKNKFSTDPFIFTIDSFEEISKYTQPSEELFIIGGAEVFNRAFNELEVKKIYRTIIHGYFPECNIHIPKFDLNSYKEFQVVNYAPDELNKYGCTISILEKN